MGLRARRLFGKNQEAGFTLVELLIVILIVGILAAVAVPLYLGYTRDAISAEGKALAGSALTAFQACTQAKGGGQSCSLSEVSQRVGVSSATGLTGDNRWAVGTGSTLSVNTQGTAFVGNITVIGQAAKNTDNIAISMFLDSVSGAVLRCDLNSTTPPASSTAGEKC